MNISLINPELQKDTENSADIKTEFIIEDIFRINETIYKLTLSAKNTIIYFPPGTYCKIYINGKDYSPHSYSVVKSYDSNTKIEIHIRVSRKNTHMRDKLKLGKVLSVTGPFGSAFNFSSKKATFFLAEGIGLAAFYSILNNQYYQPSGNDEFLWIRNYHDLAYAKAEIIKWKQSIHTMLLEANDEIYTQLKNILDIFFKKSKSVRLIVAGSPKLYDWIYEYIAINHKESTELIYDL